MKFDEKKQYQNKKRTKEKVEGVKLPLMENQLSLRRMMMMMMKMKLDLYSKYLE